MATNYCKLNGVELTDQGRTLTEGRDKRAVEQELSNGDKMEYVKKIARTWTLDWEWLPDVASQTVDGKGARNAIKAIAYVTSTLSFVLHDLTGDTTYTVRVKDYKEDIVRRDYTDGIFFYKVSLVLEEK